MTGQPLCSVIIPTYNRMALARHTLESLTRQTLPLNSFEVLVVDDGSTDDTKSMVDGYRERLNLRYFFQPDEGWRTAKARNVGISHARADTCVFVDSGVLLHSGCLAAHVASMEAEAPTAVCGYVYCFNFYNAEAEKMRQDIDPSDPDTTIARLDKERRWLDMREEFYEKYGDDFNYLPAPWVMYWTCNVSARTTDLRSTGMFDEAFRSWGGEDLDLAYRLYRKGVRFVLNRQACAIHYPHKKVREENGGAGEANYQYMVDKYRTPIMQLVRFNSEVNLFTLNDIIRERGLPSCADYLAQQEDMARDESDDSVIWSG